jgi:hypothetical protein
VLTYIQALWMCVSVRLASARRSEEGSAVEKVILTAIFAALAIAVGTIIALKVTAKAQSINLN